MTATGQSEFVSRRRRTSPIDPRIRERRIEVQRSAGRRRLRKLVILGVVLAVVAGLVVAARSPLLAVRHVRVQGATRTSASAVVAASGIRIGQPVFGVSSAGARRSIARLPWVASVSVKRSLPNTVVVRVTERVSTATVAAASGGWLEVDTSGRVLSKVATQPAGLVVVAGLHAQAAPGQQVDAPAGLLALAAAVPTSLQPLVAGVDAAPGSLQLRLRDGGVVQLGANSDLAAKLASVRTVLTSEGVRPSCIKVLDVTVATAPALTPRADCA